MNPTITTLLSDLGGCNTSVAMAKATFTGYVPNTVIFDISHHVAQYDLQQAAYLLSAAYAHFPRGTAHVILVDVFRGNIPRMIAAEKDGHYFIAPDNGVLPLAFGGAITDMRFCFECGKPYIFKEWVSRAGQIIEKIKEENGLPNYPVCEIRQAPNILQPKLMTDGVECKIRYIDRYENVALDITKDQFDSHVEGRPFKIKISRLQAITGISINYNDVAYGAPLCRFNAAGYLEIALNHGKAASLLGLSAYHTGNLHYQTIKILF